ncbi:MAG: hypothetical protein AB7G48_10030 [Nitrospiraceae bacterium]
MNGRIVHRLDLVSGASMATRDDEWPAYVQWYCCSSCRRLWTYQGSEMVVLESQFALAPALPTPGVPARSCLACEGRVSAPTTRI